MKTRNKVLGLSLGAAALVGASVMGTMAYLTSQDTVTNKFTVGSVSLGDDQQAGLDEAKVDLDGNVIAGEGRVQANTYKLVPGHEYTKDPTVHVKNDSETSYIFVKIENGLASVEASENTIASQILAADDAENWQPLNGVDNVYWLKWEQPKNATEEYTNLVVFEKLKISNTVSADELKTLVDNGAQIKVTAYAVQFEGFDDVDAAWQAASASASASN